jgi:recombination protein RecT
MAEQTAVAVTDVEDPKTFPGMLVAFKAQIAAALPKHISADRMARIALTSFRQVPLLARCPPVSVFAAVIQSAQLGLEIGLNGRGFLVPYKRKDGTYECQFIPGWKGLVELANRTGRCSVWTGGVFKGDAFDYELGDSPFVKHKPGAEDDPKKLTHVYAVGRIRGNEYPVIEVWPIDKVRNHFERYNKVGERHYGFGNWEMYSRKVPLLQVLKYMPSSPELEAAIALSNVADLGQAQELNLKDAIEGTFVAPPMEEEPGAGAGGDGKKGGYKEPRSKKQASTAGAATGSTAATTTAATASQGNPEPPKVELANEGMITHYTKKIEAAGSTWSRELAHAKFPPDHKLTKDDCRVMLLHAMQPSGNPSGPAPGELALQS